ncbi:hypothetical protein CSIM01_06288 [Colletotrichum simmondsii]|uniref:Peptidase S8/S53 domain-containing protein n=1 Tax=Colletotrichum simmondsii TaxID=703756 RepID=A0A135S0X0_9PEZI|nr:hypothetical protein CSIM01_06288 [Colletotrichum simmondsii]
MSTSHAVINGKTWSPASAGQQAAASETGYILIRTTGEPLRKAEKTQLGSLGVQIHEFLGGGGPSDDQGEDYQQIYLCGFSKGSPLEPVRNLDYIDCAEVYSNKVVIHDAVKRLRARPIVPRNPSRLGAVKDFITYCSAVISDRVVHIPGAAYPSEAASEDKIIEVDVLLHHDITSEVKQAVVANIRAIAGQDSTNTNYDSATIRLKIKEKDLDTIANLDEVRVIHPVNERVLMANIARGVLGFPHNLPFPPQSYQGRDQLVCVADTGFDRGDTRDVHQDFVGRVEHLRSWGRLGPTDDPDGHGTHVSGCVLGRGQHQVAGQPGPVIGTAPAASLMLQSSFVKFNERRESVLGGYPPDLGSLFSEAYRIGARVHNNSWGTPPLREENFEQRPYDASTESIDRFIWNHQDMTVLFAAGNSGRDNDRNGQVSERSLGAEASAKNCITVGASENLRSTLAIGRLRPKPYEYGFCWPQDFPINPIKEDHMADNPEGLAAFSSRGPTKDGRLKPDVVAPGTAILSARSRGMVFVENEESTVLAGDPNYLYMSGTSMATPLVAGCCAVLREALLANGYKDVVGGTTNPTGALIKALIINGAVTITGQYPSEDLSSGPNPHSGFKDTLALKVTMTYADLPGAALSNDLNLLVFSGDGTKQRHGNQGDSEFAAGSQGPFDRRNNAEQIVCQVTGESVKIQIQPYRLMLADVPFAYAWSFSRG